MHVDESIKGRYSCRAFLNTPVSKDILNSILDTARWAPSSTNMQPWQVAVVQGESLRQIAARMTLARQQGDQENPDFQYYPSQWLEPYQGRRRATGLALYRALGVGKDDPEGRMKAWCNNYQLFGAPVGLLIFIDQGLAEGSLIDAGIFVQSLVLAAREHGLDSCIQASLGEFPDIVREVLNIGPDKRLVCGVALGYADPDAAVNQYRTPRVAVEDFTRWYD